MMSAMRQKNIIKPGLKKLPVLYYVLIDTSHWHSASISHCYQACLTVKLCQCMFLHGTLYASTVGIDHPGQIPYRRTRFTTTYEFP